MIDRYQTTSHAPEALYRLVEANLTLGLVGEAVKDGAVLGYNYPGDVWYHDAYHLLTTKGLRPALPPGSGGDTMKNRLPFIGREKQDIAPPPVDVATGVVAETNSNLNPGQKTTPKTKPAKKDDLIHGALGL